MKSDEKYLTDIKNSTEQIIIYLKNISLDEFNKDEKTQDAVIRRFEIIGEASNKLSDEFKKKYSNIPWKQMNGLRNILIHNYCEVDLELVYNTAVRDIPILLKNLVEIITV